MVILPPAALRAPPVCPGGDVLAATWLRLARSGRATGVQELYAPNPQPTLHASHRLGFLTVAPYRPGTGPVEAPTLHGSHPKVLRRGTPPAGSCTTYSQPAETQYVATARLGSRRTPGCLDALALPPHRAALSPWPPRAARPLAELWVPPGGAPGRASVRMPEPPWPAATAWRRPTRREVLSDSYSSGSANPE